MLEIFAEENVKLQNVYAPLSLSMHIGFCVIATLVYAALFYRRRTYNYLCLLAAVDLTIITQFFPEERVITALFIIEIGLIAASAIYSFRASKAKKTAAAASASAPAPKAGTDDSTDDDEADEA